MLSKKKKLSKKEIKEDKLVTQYYNFVSFYEDNKNRILTIAAAVAIVVVALILYNNKMDQENREATTQLSRVLPLYNQNKFEEAINGKPGTGLMGLEAIVNEYGGTDQGEIAKIYLAHSYYFLENYEKSLDYYKDYSGGNPVFEASALAGQANYYEIKGNNEKAAELNYDAAQISENNPSNAQYLINAAKNYAELGNNERAREIYEKVKEEYPNTMQANEVDRYLALLTN